MFSVHIYDLTDLWTFLKTKSSGFVMVIHELHATRFHNQAFCVCAYLHACLWVKFIITV